MPELDLGNVKGPQGKSAYQSALDAGYSGSEEAFNTAMAKAPDAVLYTAQNLTDEQKAQARGNINAAPGGFGLGELIGRTANGFSDITGYGFFRIPTESGFAPDTSTNWGGVYIGASLSYGTLLYARNNALMAVRSVSGGKVGPIEWVNPPMAVGVEYRTTERYLERPVYAKLVDCGQIADNKQVEHGIVNMRDCTFAQGFRAGMPMPAIYNHNLSDPWSCYIAAVAETKITLACGTSAAGGNCFVMLKYTKTTD